MRAGDVQLSLKQPRRKCENRKGMLELPGKPSRGGARWKGSQGARIIRARDGLGWASKFTLGRDAHFSGRLVLPSASQRRRSHAPPPPPSPRAPPPPPPSGRRAALNRAAPTRPLTPAPTRPHCSPVGPRRASPRRQRAFPSRWQPSPVAAAPPPHPPPPRASPQKGHARWQLRQETDASVGSVDLKFHQQINQPCPP